MLKACNRMPPSDNRRMDVRPQDCYRGSAPAAHGLKDEVDAGHEQQDDMVYTFR